MVSFSCTDNILKQVTIFLNLSPSAAPEDPLGISTQQSAQNHTKPPKHGSGHCPTLVGSASAWICNNIPTRTTLLPAPTLTCVSARYWICYKNQPFITRIAVDELENKSRLRDSFPELCTTDSSVWGMTRVVRLIYIKFLLHHLAKKKT